MSSRNLATSSLPDASMLSDLMVRQSIVYIRVKNMMRINDVARDGMIYVYTHLRTSNSASCIFLRR